ncbi:dTDP-4-dehydrorhamnose reductase [Butyricicoccus sp. Marseille-Q5471]|uniref:dTDP-4-dehydrorhamnose reductase n=1 Tax=Butyricicoccus sp. Marseille-Q5471 TaxID=3039493 RepID=UPI0024BCE4AD|nr:dTDP-4-dehydrorhamnose reductase [Butyricicoccus sp. Marseille-Q5471]
MSNTRIWITGSSGRLGSALRRLLDCVECRILVSDDDVPVGDSAAVNHFADVSHPDVIINCAGLTDVHLCESDPELAYKTNALGARNLAVAARRLDAKLIQISTDDVFEGLGTKPLHEFLEPHPTTIYGKSKYAGECLVRELTDKHVIVRSSWIYGAGTNDFVDQVLAAARNGQPICLPGDEISSPTSADALADFIQKLIYTREYGVYHASCTGSCSRAEFAREILRLAGYDDVSVESTIAGETLRPRFTLLDNMMMRMTELHQMPDWKDALSVYLAGRKEGKA